ncbi:MAG: hypothetical protein OQJ89_09915 [Kangiellaceae bacterium]|nr:hypothetical protein [Kangiellaceae bacterium]MCW8997478.1 hypothetical protein [Kangiellaceae bacterium]MCW9017271.1 hypothetical protein [Kangiellaceae bacterium]
MGLKILIVIALAIFTACVAYTSWYFGFNAGFDKAKSQYSKSFYSPSSKVEAPKVKVPSTNRVAPILPKSKFQFADNSRSVQEANRVIQKAKRIRGNQSKQRQSDFVRTAKSDSILLSEKTVNCRWTVGRLEELTRIIRSGGKGSRSRFCKEYKQRLGELAELNCSNRNNRVFSGMC